MEEVLRRINEILKNRNISQNRLSKELNISQSYLNEMLNGKKKISLDYLFEICNFLGYEIKIEKKL